MTTPNATRTDTAKRTGRGALQGIIAQGLIRLVMVLPDPDLMIDPNDYSIITIIVTAAVTGIQNLIENLTGRAIWKNVPEEPEAAV